MIVPQLQKLSHHKFIFLSSEKFIKLNFSEFYASTFKCINKFFHVIFYKNIIINIAAFYIAYD